MTDALSQLFGADKHLAVTHECARTILVFAYGFKPICVAAREWTRFDSTAAIIVGYNPAGKIKMNKGIR